MTLGNRRRHNATSSNTTSMIQNVSTGQSRATESEEVARQTNKIYLRGPSQLPPSIPNEQDRPLIRPEGGTQWAELPTLGEGRTPASVLTCLLKKYHPGLVKIRGKEVVATTWKHYLIVQENGLCKADDVEAGFWERFRFEPELERKARKHVGACCKQLLTNFKYYLRINAIMDHCRKVENQAICDKVAGRRYLTKQQYIDQMPEWFAENAWKALASEWIHPDFIERSKKCRENRYKGSFKPHRDGSNSIATIIQRLSKKEGRVVSELEAWVYTHRGSNPEAPDALNTEEATECLERYKGKAIELNGPDFDWLHSPVDLRALHACSCGRRHGKWATFNGTVDDTEALAEVRSDHDSLRAAKRQRKEEEEREKRRLVNDANMWREYALTLLEWGRGAQQRDQNLQMFMEHVARHTGMPPSAVPPPGAPLPPPPMFSGSASLYSTPSSLPEPACGASTSPNSTPLCTVDHAHGGSVSPHLSPEDDDTFGAAIGLQNPEETLQRIAQGVFGGYGNGCRTGGGSFSPLDEDLTH